MPLPKPHTGESRDDFMKRCMADPATQDITGNTADESQQRRVAACERQFDDAQKEAEMDAVAKRRSDGIDVKAFGVLEIKDAEKGEVAAVVATLGVVDNDGDVLLPGCVKGGEAQVKMSGYGHDVVLDGVAPVGMGVIKEQGDSLVFKGRFFLSTERGREAFATVKELGSAGEWSFGFPRGVTTGEMTKEWAQKGARRLISGLTPIEASPVFVGAGIGTRTLSVKTASAPTQSVGGQDHPASDFAVVPDPEKSSTWKLPIFDADHVRNALARFDQTEIPAGLREEARHKIIAAAHHFGVDPASLMPKPKAAQFEMDPDLPERIQRAARMIDSHARLSKR